ncbi:M23 family metallopeptidase [Thermasporomyces composti]|jgi:murein DD-endopeptidase MepM/ murein hydrolase activator NlpD|nr:M23 family metallopeptidase [Thermasporomyces composti]
MKLDIFNADGESRGTDVVASAAGVVDRVKPSNGQVKIHHGGRWYTMYIHMGRIVVHDGQRVEAGQKIGEVGSVNTGVAHLHYEQIYDQNNDGYGSSPAEITYPVIQGVKYSLSPGDEPIVKSENGC